MSRSSLLNYCLTFHYPHFQEESVILICSGREFQFGTNQSNHITSVNHSRQGTVCVIQSHSVAFLSKSCQYTLPALKSSALTPCGWIINSIVCLLVAVKKTRQKQTAVWSTWHVCTTWLNIVNAEDWLQVVTIFDKTIGLLQQTVTWYKIRHAGGQKNVTASKTKRFQSVRLDFSLSFMSQRVACPPAWRILYHVTGCCKRPIR